MRIIGSVSVAVLLAMAALGQTKDSRPSVQASQQTAAVEIDVSKIDSTKEADTRRLLEVAGTRELVTEMIAGMERDVRPLMSKALPPGDYRDKLVDLFFEKFRSRANPEQVLNLVVPVYEKHLSDAEIKGLIDFYSTPLGQKAVRVLPNIFSECQEVGRKWGEQIGQDSMMEVLKEHPELQKALNDAKDHPSQ